MRTKTFDELQALERAMQIFWSKGFDGTTLQDLEQGMGIARQSLYNTFGNKQALFEQALDHYHREVIVKNLAPIAESDQPLDTIERYFLQRIDAVFDPAAIKGCLMTNTITERALFDPAARAAASRSLRYMQDVFGQAISKARDQGLIPAHKNVEQSALMLVNFTQGLFVMSRMTPNRLSLVHLLDQQMEHLKH